MSIHRQHFRFLQFDHIEVNGAVLAKLFICCLDLCRVVRSQLYSHNECVCVQFPIWTVIEDTFSYIYVVNSVQFSKPISTDVWMKIVCSLQNKKGAFINTLPFNKKRKKGFNCSFNKDLTVYYCDMCVMSLFVYFNILYIKSNTFPKYTFMEIDLVVTAVFLLRN